VGSGIGVFGAEVVGVAFGELLSSVMHSGASVFPSRYKMSFVSAVVSIAFQYAFSGMPLHSAGAYCWSPL
jgi:hypothetical protein